MLAISASMSCQRRLLVAAAQPTILRSDQSEVVLAVPVAHGLRFAGIGQPLQGVLANRLQHAVASRFGDDQRAIHEPAEQRRALPPRKAPSPAQIASAAANVQPPTKTARRCSSRHSAGVSWL